MNTIIKDLVDQSTETLSGWDERRGNYREPLFHKDKFAELLIAQCVKICMSSVGNSDYNTGRMHCANEIKQHFGIK